MLPDSYDASFMAMALEQAEKAYYQDEVPIGAVLIDNKYQVVASAHNQTLQMNDPSAHAEILALRQAGQQLGNHRLLNTTLYVTLEPCVMCAGALVQARIERLVFAASDPKGGAVHSTFNIIDNDHLNHRIQNCSGLCQSKSVILLQQFFREKRQIRKR